MRGGAPFKTPWPKENTTLPRDDRIALQKRLATLGYDVKLFNGPITFEQRDFIRAEQVKLGMLPDGHASAALLDRMGYQAEIATGVPDPKFERLLSGRLCELRAQRDTRTQLCCFGSEVRSGASREFGRASTVTLAPVIHLPHRVLGFQPCHLQAGNPARRGHGPWR